MQHDGKQVSFTGERTDQRYVAPLQHLAPPKLQEERGAEKGSLVFPGTASQPREPTDCFLNRSVLFEGGKQEACILNRDEELY